MATTVRDIQASGGDYTTVGSWESATTTNSGADIWKGECAAEDFDEAIVIANTETIGASAYVWLSSQSGSEHSGVYSTSKARMAYTGGATAVIDNDEDYTRISWMQIHRPSSGSSGNSDEGIRAGNVDNMLIQYMVIWTDEIVQNMDGIHMDGGFDNAANTLYIDNCVIYGFARGGVHCNYGDKDHPTLVRIDHCFITYNGDSSAGQSNEGNLLNWNATEYSNWTVYNTIIATNGATTDAATQEWKMVGASNQAVADGDYNVRTGSGETDLSAFLTDNTANWVDATDGVTDSAPATGGVYVADFTGITTFDLTLQSHANNVAEDAGVAQSEPDSRQDFSVDITGAARPTSGSVDIGPFQITSSGSMAPLAYHYLTRMRG